MVLNFEVAAIVILVIWLAGVTIFLFRISSHYNRLTKGVSTKTLKSILEDVLQQVAVSHKEIEEIKKRTQALEIQSEVPIQKVGLLRFNPFKDTGGEQSFILALLDAQGSGVVLSSLYARSGARWYAKKVTEGKGVEHELSDEEKQVIKHAR